MPWRSRAAGCLPFGLCAVIAAAQSYSLPAGVRPPSSSPGAAILPGGRVVAPVGEQYPTGATPVGLAASPSGKYLVSTNVGRGTPSLTVMEKGTSWEVRQVRLPDGQDTDSRVGISTGIAFSGERTAFVSEGNSGQVVLIDLATGERRRTIDLNQNGFADSFAGEIVLDTQHDIVYVADPANSRVAVAEVRSRRIVASLNVSYRPVAMTLSPDQRTLYVARLGNPHASDSHSVAIVDVSDPGHPKLEAFIRTGLTLGGDVHSGGSPSGILATGNRVFVANAGSDSITVIDARSRRIESELPIRVPGLEHLRGILPAGLAFHQKSGWLLVAEAGINAVGVIDTNSGTVLGHIPAGSYPTRVLLNRDTVFVANLRGQGARFIQPGSVSIYPLPAAGALPGYTEFVMRSCGFIARPKQPPPPPEPIQHVVLIVKGARSFDEVLGDVTRARNGEAMAAPALAHLGTQGYADGERKRLSLQQVNITPNHHSIAQRWAFHDNFYADSGVESLGHRWLEGSYPTSWSEASLLAGFRMKDAGFPGVSAELEDGPEAGTIWNYFSNHGISYQVFAEDLNSQIPDTQRASRFIEEIDRRFVKTGADFPRFLYVVLPNDSISRAQPENGYPYPESAAADNDYALGRILEYLSKTPWWKQMAVFITQAAASGLDHLDARRTMLLCAGPWAKPNYVSHTNSSFPSLLKTIFAIFRLPPLNLFDAAAAGLSDCFTTTPDFRPYQAAAVDPRIYDPGKEPH